MSAREAEVLALLGKHLTHAEIAARLVVSVRTVESHVASLRRKLGIAGHRDLVRYAVARHHAPPVPLTSLVGRLTERAEVRDALHASRLVSIVGTGGVGKTTLARAVADDVADEFPDGVWQVDVVPVSDAATLANAVAAACGVADQPGRSTGDALVRGLADTTALLLLDNCEHVANAVAVLVDRLVARCPRVRVLVTSRARLVLPFERVYPLAGLAPDDAAVLFETRAKSAGWRTTDAASERTRIDAICSQLDGIALALELAAVRLPTLGLDGVERGLSDQSDLLVGGPRAAARHRSMRDTLAWSYQLLAPTEQAVLCRVCVFATGFDADAAATVAGFDDVSAGEAVNALGRLVEQSMLMAPTGRRWRMLEPVRQFALSRQDAQQQVAYARHFDWVCARARSLDHASGADSRDWYGSFDEIADELRAAVAWSQSPDATRLLATLLFRSGRAREAQLRFEQAGSLADAAAVASCRVQGEDALRLHLADRNACRERGDDEGYGAATARAAELILRFEGMFAGPVPSADDLLAELDPRYPTAARLIAANRVDPDDPSTARHALHAADRAHTAGSLLRESAALDIATGAQIMGARLGDAVVTARRRVALFAGAVLEPQSVLELKDALRMGVLTGVGVGDLDFALACAERQRTMPALREQRDLAIDEALLPEVLAGRWDEARADAETFLADWDAAGRPSASGRAVGPAAVAMMHGLSGEESARTKWLGVVSALRRSEGTRGAAYLELFDAVVMAHRGEPRAALARVANPLSSWWGGLFERWRLALVAECERDAAGSEVLERVRAAVAGQVADGSTI